MTWDEAIRILSRHAEFETNVVFIYAVMEFEPWGKASEDWDLVWRIVVPSIPYHWMSTTGWRISTTTEPIEFKGHTLQEAQEALISFITWWDSTKR